MYKKKAHIHFVGIGGIGMSGIATILAYQGYTISGCDLDIEQQSVRQLKDMGCSIFEGHNCFKEQNITPDVVVYTSAVKPSHPEILAAQKLGIPTIGRALMLAELMRTKYSVAIAGSHGKTTTTSMIAHILIEAEKDPTVIIGGHLKNISSNARFGDGDFLVAEADESDRSLLRLHATLAVITNIDLEHLETYKDLDDIKETFKAFLLNLPFYGKAIICLDDPNIRSLLPLPSTKIISYGINEDADYQAKTIQLMPETSSCQIYNKKADQIIGNLTINMAGIHNVSNALAATAVALDLDVSFEQVTKALASFKGIDRRFTYHGTYRDAEIFDDYGHHPKEIYYTLMAARRRAKNRLIVVFQPHRYTRTSKLWDDFVNMFKSQPIDELIITDIYSASEEPIEGVTSKKMCDAITQAQTSYPVTYAPFSKDFNNIKAVLDTRIAPNDLVLLLGAGKLNLFAAQLTDS